MNNSTSKKGIAVIGWVLLVLFTVAAAMTVINWAKSHGKMLTEETVSYVEGRIDCQQVRIANISHTCAALSEVELKNIGTLNIDKVSARTDGKSSEIKDLELKAQGEAKKLTTANFKTLTVIPILEKDGELIGCKEKSVTVRC